MKLLLFLTYMYILKKIALLWLFNFAQHSFCNYYIYYKILQVQLRVYIFNALSKIRSGIIFITDGINFIVLISIGLGACISGKILVHALKNFFLFAVKWNLCPFRMAREALHSLSWKSRVRYYYWNVWLDFSC